MEAENRVIIAINCNNTQLNVKYAIEPSPNEQEISNRLTDSLSFSHTLSINAHTDPRCNLHTTLTLWTSDRNLCCAELCRTHNRHTQIFVAATDSRSAVTITKYIDQIESFFFVVWHI